MPDIGSWEVLDNLEVPTGSEFDGLIQVTLPSDIWITPESARRFASDLINAADRQDLHNRMQVESD